MRADIHDGQEHKRSVQGPDTEAQDLSPPNHHFPLATRGRSIQVVPFTIPQPTVGYLHKADIPRVCSLSAFGPKRTGWDAAHRTRFVSTRPRSEARMVAIR